MAKAWRFGVIECDPQPAKEKLVLDWRKQQTTRAMVLTTIKDVLDELPRAYTKDLCEQKCDIVYQHF